MDQVDKPEGSSKPYVVHPESGPYHEFVLLRYDDFPLSDWGIYSSKIHQARRSGTDGFQSLVKLSDDFLQHIYDYVLWIDAVNPAKMYEPVKGLCYYGPTAIMHEGASTARSVFGNWARLLNAAPDPSLLMGHVAICESDSQGKCVPGTEVFQKTCYPKDVLVEQLFQLESFADQVCSSPKDYYIFHLGI